MDFSSSSSGSSSSGSQPSPEVFMDQLKSQLAQAYAEEFLETRQLHNSLCGSIEPPVLVEFFLLKILASTGLSFSTVRGKCFSKCITKPGTSLSGGESSCVSRCVDRYIEATGIVSRALFSQTR
ncbi:hypothetical protein C5167_027577 [Papaver somniferum]|nr:hypothetical protein C5167_027577 [Papaver somniferum]